MTLQPAYGRDYKTAKAAKADFADDKDFIIADFNDPYSGKPVNRSQLKEEGRLSYVNIRFCGDRKVTVVKL